MEALDQVDYVDPGVPELVRAALPELVGEVRSHVGGITHHRHQRGAAIREGPSRGYRPSLVGAVGSAYHRRGQARSDKSGGRRHGRLETVAVSFQCCDPAHGQQVLRPGRALRA